MKGDATMNVANVFATAGKIAGIGGLSIALIVLLLRPVIAANILQVLSVPARERILRLVVGGALSIALAGLGAYVFSTWQQSASSEATLSVGRNATVGGNADIGGRAQIGNDLSVGNDLQVGGASRTEKSNER
jgi:hypothetical protein